MKIETIYNIGDSVWVMEHNRPKSYEIAEIHISVTLDCNYQNDISVAYEMNDEYESRFGEEECYKTKRDCVMALMEE